MFSISHHFNLADGQLTTCITTLFTSLLNERRDRKVRALPSPHLQRERSFSLQVGHPPGLKGPKASPLDQLPSHEHALDPRPLRHLSDLQTAGQRRPVFTEHSSRFTLRCTTGQTNCKSQSVPDWNHSAVSRQSFQSQQQKRLLETRYRRLLKWLVSLTGNCPSKKIKLSGSTTSCPCPISTQYPDIIITTSQPWSDPYITSWSFQTKSVKYYLRDKRFDL